MPYSGYYKVLLYVVFITLNNNINNIVYFILKNLTTAALFIGKCHSFISHKNRLSHSIERKNTYTQDVVQPYANSADGYYFSLTGYLLLSATVEMVTFGTLTDACAHSNNRPCQPSRAPLAFLQRPLSRPSPHCVSPCQDYAILPATLSVYSLLSSFF